MNSISGKDIGIKLNSISGKDIGIKLCRKLEIEQTNVDYMEFWIFAYFRDPNY